MSAIASFIRIPKAALHGLRAAATPRKKLFGGVRCDFPEYLRKHGEEDVNYPWSGWVFNTLLVYLQEVHQIDLVHSEYDELSAFLAQSVGGTHLFLTPAHRQAYLTKLESEFESSALCDYYDKFNEANEDGAGEPMLDGIRALRECLRKLDHESVVVFSIG